MKVLRLKSSLKRQLSQYSQQRVSLGFVPTMGALHEGHIELVEQSLRRYQKTCVSIFVNPLQFGPKEDFKKYPRRLNQDVRKLKDRGCHILFVPSTKEFYPEEFQTFVETSRVSKGLCGQSRPIHFKGVCTVVLKLLNLVQPTGVFLGQKDYQQVCVIRTMIRDLDVPVKVHMVSTIREADGLAMSSRNQYLSAAHRQVAPALYDSLRHVKKQVSSGERHVTRLEKSIKDRLKKYPMIDLEYAHIVEQDTLKTVLKLLPGKAYAALVAGTIGKTRLIDNILFEA